MGTKSITSVLFPIIASHIDQNTYMGLIKILHSVQNTLIYTFQRMLMPSTISEYPLNNSVEMNSS